MGFSAIRKCLFTLNRPGEILTLEPRIIIIRVGIFFVLSLFSPSLGNIFMLYTYKQISRIFSYRRQIDEIFLHILRTMRITLRVLFVVPKKTLLFSLKHNNDKRIIIV